MADQSFDLDIFRDLLEATGVVGQIAKDEKTFAAIYNAFRSEDATTFQRLLSQLHAGIPHAACGRAFGDPW